MHAGRPRLNDRHNGQAGPDKPRFAPSPAPQAWLAHPPAAGADDAVVAPVLDTDETKIRAAIRMLLEAVGEDPDRDGLLKTPDRVARMYGELLAGYGQDLDALLNGAFFEVGYDEGEMVTVANIPFTSLCEHHLLPFTGTAHVAYVPRGTVVGLSKIPRIVDMFAQRLQVQERLTGQIADAMMKALDPRGVMVMVEGAHSCCSMRGVKKEGVGMITTARRGSFREQPQMTEQFYRQIGR